MAKSLSTNSSESQNTTSLDLPQPLPSSQTPLSISPPVPLRRLYFINEQVEWLLTQYLWTGCTRVKIRDQIMSHAAELIRQIIRKQGLHTIYPGQDESSFGDLLHIAYCQLERTLYKYRALPHCRQCFSPDRPSDSLLYKSAEHEYGIKSMDEIIKLNKGKCPKCKTKLSAGPIVEPAQGLYGGSTTILYRGQSKVFNLWSQISRTVILAFIKKEGRDRKNSPSYINHVNGRANPASDIILRFLREAKELCKFNDEYLKIIEALEWLIHNDERPHDGIIGKLVERSGVPRTSVTSFMQLIKLRSLEFTDSPLNRNAADSKLDKRKMLVEFDEES